MPRFVILAMIGLLTAIACPAVCEPSPASADPAAAPAGLYVLDKSHASVVAKVSHMGLSFYTLRFDALDARFDYDPAKPEASQITATVDANSLDVGDPKTGPQFARDFLAAAVFPRITFVSTGIQRTAPGHGLVTGNLTLGGVTRPVILDVVFNGSGPGPFGVGGYRMGFSATTDIKRSDFGSKAWESLVGDQVHLVRSEVEFSPQIARVERIAI